MKFISYFCFVYWLSLICGLSAAPDCDVVSKKEWGGLDAIHAQYLPRPLDLVIIAHTASPTCNTDEKCAEFIRNIQNYHVDTLKYWDIGYSFLVGGNGKVYEGNGWHRVGAHTKHYNRKSIAIAFIGNFNNDDPKPAALEAVKALLKCGVEKGHLTPNYHLVGHRQVLSIESPGTKLYNEIRKWPQWLEDVSSIKVN